MNTTIVLCGKCGGMIYNYQQQPQFSAPINHMLLNPSQSAQPWNTASIQYLPVPMGAANICPGHSEPTQKHDGKLDSETFYTVGYGNVNALLLHGPIYGVTIEGKYSNELGEDRVGLTPEQALSLLAWLRQEEEPLKSMAGQANAE